MTNSSREKKIFKLPSFLSMLSWYRVSSSFSISLSPIRKSVSTSVPNSPISPFFVPFTPVARNGATFLSPLPPKENKDYSRSWESKLSPSRLVCKGASGQARSIAIRLETELCALPLSLSILGERWMLVHSRSRRRSRKFPTAACTRPR